MEKIIRLARGRKNSDKRKRGVYKKKIAPRESRKKRTDKYLRT